jgi:hypothetical protein
MNAFMAPAAKKVLQSIAALNVGKASEAGAREGEFLETIELFFERGLLQGKKT